MQHRKRIDPSGRVSPFDIGLFYLACGLVAAFGGTSRSDLAQVPILQISLCIVAAIAVWRVRKVEAGVGLLLLLFLYGLWLALQLLPLPHGFWSALPGRQPIEAAEIAVGQHFSRPFSLDPSRTLNALGNLAAIAAPLLASLSLRHEAPRHILLALVAISAISSLLVVFQMLFGSPYLYRITNEGQPVGLFANTNHFAVYASAMVVVVAFLSNLGRMQVRIGAVALALFILASALISPSRAGFMAAMLASIAFGVLVLDRRLSATSLANLPPAAKMLGISAVAAILLVGFAAVYLGGFPAIDRIFSTDTFADLRFAILPTLLIMAGDFAPTGSGVGSFEEAYRMYEVRELLHPNYVNMAHNDVIQVFIEGGLFSVAFLAAFAFLAFKYLRRAAVVSETPWRLLFCAATVAAICVIGSAVDYPLRAPIFQMTVVLLVAALAGLGARGGVDSGARSESQ